LFFITEVVLMIKSTLTLIVLLFFFSSNAAASLITGDLPEDTYFEYGGYDWTWASPVNSTLFTGLDPTTDLWVDENVLEAPTFRSGWMYITGSELEQLFSELTLANFQSNGGLIQSAAYWNSHFTHVDDFNFSEKSSLPVAQFAFGDHYETFYVRASVVDVPEPTSLLIFAIGLMGLALRKKAQR
jgi:hypothetical protein